MAIRPEYYKDDNGHDLFWEMEHGMYDLAWSIGFCHINADKYERRKGRKTAIVKMSIKLKHIVMKKKN